MTTTRDQNVVDLLLEQHDRIKTLFSELSFASGVRKRELFEDLVRLLAVHESAEEQVVHPMARSNAIEQVVEARLREESEAKSALAELYDMGVDHPGFDAKLAQLNRAVVEHATHEEQEEFPYLLQNVQADRLVKMAGAVRAAESVAPTRPHPAAGESATANMLAGPPAAVFDRMRDAVRDWREKSDS